MAISPRPENVVIPGQPVDQGAMRAHLISVTAEIEGEIADRIAGDQQNAQDIVTEAQTREQDDNAEAAARQAGDVAEAQARAQAVSNEADLRETADQQLQQNLNNASQTLQTNIDDEEAARINADAGLQTTIDSEQAAREAGDQGLQTNINNEQAAREAGDQGLQNTIDNEEAARVAADQGLQTTINNEEAARVAADQSLQTSISNEEAARISGDQGVQQNLNAETAARTNEDASIRADFTAADAAINGALGANDGGGALFDRVGDLEGRLSPVYATAGGTVDAIALTTPADAGSVVEEDGLTLVFVPAGRNTGPATVALNGGTALPLVADVTGAALATDALGAAPVLVVYDAAGARWRLMAQETAEADTAKADIRARPTGVVPAGALTPFGWESDTELTIFESNFWGAVDNDHYIADQNDNDVTTYLRTTRESRDQEIDTFTRVGTVYFRIKDGKALYMLMQGNLNVVAIGVVEGLDTESPSVKQQESYNFLADAQAIGYDSNDTENVVWTFGVSGFDMYFKLNGVELKRWPYFGFYQAAAGKMGVKSPTVYGFRDLVARFLEDAPIHSDPENNIFDMRDFGLKDLKALGEMDAGSSTLRLANNPGFEIGDTVIVEIGGEESRGHPGTKGVGGTWPALTYPTEADKDADTGQPVGVIAWTEDTGRIHTWGGSTWSERSQAAWYTHKAVPLSLVAEITAIDGDDLTLDQSATVATKGAAVYYANTPEITDPILGEVYYPLPGGSAAFDWLPEEVEIVFPRGRFAFSDKIAVLNPRRDGWTIRGMGKDATELFSPKGVPSLTMPVTSVDRAVIRDFTLRGNVRASGFGFANSILRAPSPQTSFPSGSAYPDGIRLNTCEDTLVRDVRTVDIWQGGVTQSFCNNCWGETIEVVMTDGLFQYIQWLLLIADSIGGGYRHCSVDSPVMTGGLETFRSSGTVFSDIRMRNGGVSVNSAGDWLIEDLDIVLEADSSPTNESWSRWNPLINVNSNINPPNATLQLGGTIRRPRVIQKGPISDEIGNNPAAIIINVHNPNITVEGTYDGVTTHHLDLFQGPDAPATGHPYRGSIAVYSTGENTIVRNIRVKGVSPHEASGGADAQANIRLDGANGLVENCVADSILVADGTETGNRTNAQYGTGP